jgi:hypothetical protein
MHEPMNYIQKDATSIPHYEPYEEKEAFFNRIGTLLGNQAEFAVRSAKKPNGDWCCEETLGAFPSWFHTNVLFDDSEYVTPYDFNKYHTYLTRAAQGRGKTFVVANMCKENMEVFRNSLFISCRVCVCKQIRSTLAQHGVQCCMYSECPDGHVPDMPAIVQLDSLSRFLHPARQYNRSESSISNLQRFITSLRSEIPSYECVFVDECEATLLHLFSTFMKKKSASILRDLIAVIQKAKRVIFADAGLSDVSLDFLLHMRGCATPRNVADISGICVKWMTRQPPRKLICRTKWKEMGPMIVKDLSDGLNVIVSCDSKNRVNKLVEFVLQKLPELDGQILCHTHDSDDEVNALISECNSEWTHRRAVFYSPTITFGLDFNQLHFHRQYAHFCGIVPALTAFQMIGRARVTHTMEVMMAIDVNSRKKPQCQSLRPEVNLAAHIACGVSRLDRMALFDPSVVMDILSIPVFIATETEAHEAIELADNIKNHPVARLYARFLDSEMAKNARFKQELQLLCEAVGYEWKWQQHVVPSEEEVDDFRCSVTYDPITGEKRKTQSREDIDRILKAPSISEQTFSVLHARSVAQTKLTGTEKQALQKHKIETQLGLAVNAEETDELSEPLYALLKGKHNLDLSNVKNFVTYLGGIRHAYTDVQEQRQVQDVMLGAELPLKIDMFMQLSRLIGFADPKTKCRLQDVRADQRISEKHPDLNMFMQHFIAGSSPGMCSFYAMCGIKSTSKWLNIDKLTYKDTGYVLKTMSKQLFELPLSVVFKKRGRRNISCMDISFEDESYSLITEAAYVSQVKKTMVWDVELSGYVRQPFVLTKWTGVEFPA